MTQVATRSQFARNLVSGWVVLVAEVAVAFVLTPFIIVKLGPATYGIWSLMIGVIGYMGLIDVGIRGSVGRYINHYLALKDARALAQVVGTANVVLTVLGGVALAASVVLGAYFGSIFPKTPPELLEPIRLCLPLMAVGLWLSFMSSIVANLLAAREAMYLTNHYNLGLLLARAALTAWALQAGQGLVALVLIQVGLGCIGLLLLYRVARRTYGPEMPPPAHFSWERLKEMWRFGIATFTTRTASTLASDSAPIVGMWLLGPEAVGIYSVAMTLAQYSRRLMDQANAAIFGSVMRAGATRDFAALRGLHLRFIDIGFAIGSLVFVGVIVFSGDFLALWVGETYREGGVVAGILAIGYLAMAAGGTAPLTLASLERLATTVRIGIGEALATVALSAALPGLFGWGLAGLALGATLPRMATHLLLYPLLAVNIMGPELRRPMWIALMRNAGLCLAVGLCFWVVSVLMPAHGWPHLIVAVALITLGHVLLLGHRYEAFPAVERWNARARALLRRLVPGAREP